VKYRPEVDGLRAVAVLPVIFFHAGFSWLSGGYVGVDVFFVISGYLITTIILNELHAGTFSIASFYERRARRILPALVFIVSVSAALSWAFLLREDFKDFFASVVAVATFSSNIYFWMEADYFDTATELRPLLHTWSLAVEEQYYIIFPVLMMALWRFGLTVIIGVMALIFVLSLGYAQMIVHDQPMTAFYLLPTRAWEIMIGAFCAFYLTRPNRPELPKSVENVLGLVGAGLIVVSVLSFTKDTPTPSFYILMPTVGAALIILFATKGTLVQIALSQRPFVFVGLISYSAYLWHQPLLAILRHNYLLEPPKMILFATAVLSLILAWLTWKFIETPFRKSKATRKSILQTSFVVTVAMCLAGLFVYMNPTLAYKNGQFNQINTQVALLDYNNNNPALQERSWVHLHSYAKSHDYVPGTSGNNNNRDWFAGEDDRLNVLLLGNSHSKDMFNVLYLSDFVQSTMQVGRFNAQVGNIGEDHALFDAQSYADADVVFIVTRFDNRRNDVSNLEPLVQRILADDKRLVVAKNVFEFPRFLGGKWTVFDRVLHEHVQQGIEDPETIVAASNKAYYDIVAGGQDDQRIIEANAEVDRLDAAYPQMLVVDRMEFMCAFEDEACYSSSPTLKKFYPDYGHYTLAGAEFFAKRAEELGWFQRILAFGTVGDDSNS